MNAPRIPLAGVIGLPASQTRLPRLFGHWLRNQGLPGHYVPLEVRPERLHQVISMLPEMGFVGVNIANPHKQKVIELADLVTDRAALIGTANTLIFRQDGRIHADNTDGYGFIENLRHCVPDWDPGSGPAVVLGAGAAARSVVASLLDVGAPEILLTNRTRVRAEQMKEDFGNRVRVVEWVQAGNILEDADCVVNATSLGSLGAAEFRVPLDGLRAGTVVADLVFAPLQTHLLTVAEEMHCRCADGLGMLLHQAVPAFERWFGRRPPVDGAARAAVLR